jgi:hypothetical protein
LESVESKSAVSSLTFRPTIQKTILRTTSTAQIERLCSVTGTLPNEVRIAFKKRHRTASVEPECAAQEKLMPCGMKYPEPIRARPDFWIPITYVCSYVIPFFMFLIVSVTLRQIPEVTYLISDAPLYGSIRVHNSIQFGFFILFFLGSPLLVGALLRSFLTKRTRMKTRLKLLVWFVSILAFCFIDYYIAAICFYPFNHF